MAAQRSASVVANVFFLENMEAPCRRKEAILHRDIIAPRAVETPV
jgi:hypothetical protein